MRRWARKLVVGVFVLSVQSIRAQAPPGEALVPCGTPFAALPPCGADEKPAADTLAIVDGTVFTLKDLAPALRRKVERREEAVAQAREDALKAEIATALLEGEAARRKLQPRDLYFLEVVKKVAAPTNAEVQAAYDSQPELYGRRPIQDQRQWITSVLLAEREKARAKELTASIQSRIPVAMKADPNARGLRETSVLSTVGGKPITLASAATGLEAAAWAFRWAIFREESEAVERLVHDHLLKAEAKRRGLTPEALVASEVSSRLAPPSQEEIIRFYQRYQTFYGNDLASVKGRIVEALQREARRVREEELETVLRAGRQVRVFVEEPARPVLQVASPAAASRGSSQAKVTLVEFGDFQCPPCGQAYGMIEEALKPFGDRVRYQFRHYPMGIHEFAPKAAQAAMAAQVQGRFWEYAEILYKNQRMLDVASLKRYAAEVRLDVDRFEKDLDSDRIAAAVLEDKRAGTRAGVTGTPALFINGVRLPETPASFSVPGIRAALESALKAAGASR